MSSYQQHHLTLNLRGGDSSHRSNDHLSNHSLTLRINAR